MPNRFRDRTDAGRQLAALLTALRGQDVLVLALPRGGVPVGYEIAHAVHASLDVLNVRKLGVPWHEELAMGAIAGGGIRVLNDDVIAAGSISATVIEEVTSLQRVELDRRERLYRGERPAPRIRGRTVILVDDGIATGATVRAAIAVARAQQPNHLVLAAPVVQRAVAAVLERDVDEVVCVQRPSHLYSIGVWYERFPQLQDEEVHAIMARAAAESVPPGARPNPAERIGDVETPDAPVT